METHCCNWIRRRDSHSLGLCRNERGRRRTRPSHTATGSTDKRLAEKLEEGKTPTWLPKLISKSAIYLIIDNRIDADVKFYEPK